MISLAPRAADRELEHDGVVGREGRRAYDWPCIIRCINTVDVMTAEGPELDWALLKRITACITAEAPGICRVCYDLTPKPAGTVEWKWRELASELAF